jgi:hypothetical protein
MFDGCSGDGAASVWFVDRDAGSGAFCGSVEAGGNSLIAFSSGGSDFVLSNSSPGTGRAFFATGGGALFTGAVTPL